MARGAHGGAMLAAVIAVGLLAGCGGTQPGQTQASITVGVLPGADLAPLHLAADEGIFERHGLEVRFDSLAPTTRDVLAAVADGRYDFGYADLVSVMSAAEEGLDVSVVSGAAATSGDRLGDFAALLVPAGSGITSLADLAGRTIAVDALGATGHVVVEAVLQAEGVDTDAIAWKEVPAVGATTALTDGSVDAALVTEPFATAARIDGMTALTFPYAEFNRDLTVTGFVTSGALLESTPDVAEAFAAAIEEALAFATENQTETRDHIAEIVDAGSQVRTRVRLPVFSSDIDAEALEQLSMAAVQTGTLAAEPDLARVFP